MKKLASMGIHVLHNENVKLPNKGDSVCLAGVNDPLADEYRLVYMIICHNYLHVSRGLAVYLFDILGIHEYYTTGLDK